MKQFEVGKSYEPSDSGFPPVTIMKRTAKMILVRGEAESCWRMRIKTDEDGNEYMTDSSVPVKWRDALTYNAKWEVR